MTCRMLTLLPRFRQPIVMPLPLHAISQQGKGFLHAQHDRYQESVAMLNYQDNYAWRYISRAFYGASRNSGEFAISELLIHYRPLFRDD